LNIAADEYSEASRVVDDSYEYDVAEMYTALARD
jgi:hypothetical protein